MVEETNVLLLVVGGLVTFLTGGGFAKALNLYFKRQKENKIDEQADAIAFRTSLLQRISCLEKEAAENREKILTLTAENARLTAENLTMQEEIERLKKNR